VIKELGMRNNPAFKRAEEYMTANNVPKEQVMGASDASLLVVMYPPDGVRPDGDYTRVSAVKRALAHVYRERLQSERVSDIRSLILVSFPNATFASRGDGDYLVRLGDDD
jgi:hypothetical protein